jgi:hypothetical protein
MYSRSDAACAWCHVDSTTRSLVDAAIEGNRVRLGAAPQQELEQAIAALDWCCKDECRAHGREREARLLLEAALDELLSDDDGGPDCPQCGGGDCAECLGLTQEAL